MTISSFLRDAIVAVSLVLLPSLAAAQVDARMFRQPDVSATHIAFVYAGDIWIVAKEGGTASRLSSPPGEETFPRFSPDGTRIAFSANYDGNEDVYVVPTLGGDVVRLTHHPMEDRVVDWHPDGTRVLFASSRESGRQRFNQFYLVNVRGGLPERLPIPYGEFGAFNADGSAFAYMPQSQDFRTWKRYRGGWAPDIWLFDLKAMTARNLTGNDANDGQPMWHGSTLYFLSDRGPSQRENIWAYDMASGAARQVTHFRDFDVTFPAVGPSDIVFQAGGRLYLLDLATEQQREVPVQVVTDRMTLKPHAAKVEKLIASASVSPTGKRGVFGARGEVFTVPAEHGAVLDVTRSAGVAERYPRWSPDGKTLAYWSDRSGEYELMLRPADGSGAEKQVTTLGKGFRYPPSWSPDNSKIAFVDQAMRVYILDVRRGEVKEIDRSPLWMDHEGLERLRLAWSPDSRYLAYTRPVETQNNALFIYDMKAGERHQATSGYFRDDLPTFDPEGKFLFYTSDRSFAPVYGRFDNSWTYPNATQLIAAPLRKDVASPIAPRNDAEGEDKDDKKDRDEDKSKDGDKDKEKKQRPAGPADQAAGQKPSDESSSDKDKASASKDRDEDADTARPEKTPTVTIDFDGFEARAVVLPPKPGNYADLYSVKGKLLYRREPRAGSGEEKSPVLYFDFEEREEKKVLDDAELLEPTFDGKKLFVRRSKKYGFVDPKPDQKFEKPMATGEMEAVVDPRAEWKQLFADAYRFERDYFYDPGMHGVDWTAMRAQYGKLLEDAVTRWDVNFVLGELIAELNSSHTYRGGGDEEEGPER